MISDKYLKMNYLCKIFCFLLSVGYICIVLYYNYIVYKVKFYDKRFVLRKLYIFFFCYMLNFYLSIIIKMCYKELKNVNGYII